MPGRGKDERLKVVGDRALPGATGDESQARFIWTVPRGGKRMKDKKASKASRGPQQNCGPDRGIPVFTQLSSPNSPGKVNRSPRYKEENFIWAKIH